MAERHLSDSLSRSSDEIFDKNCSVCERKHKVKEAIVYCSSCCEYFCTDCLDFHNSLPVLADHVAKLKGKSAMLQSPPDAGVLAGSLMTTVCGGHGNKLLMFCHSHDALCCIVCLAMEHRECKDVEYIPRLAKGFAKNPRISHAKRDIEAVKNEIVTVKASRQTDQTRIDKERNLVLSQIKDSRRRVMAAYDKLEQVATRGTDKRYHEYGGEIQADVKQCFQAINELESSVREIEGTDPANESQLFVNVQKGLKCMERWRQLSKIIRSKVGKDKIVFTLDDRVERFVEYVEKLGTFEDAVMTISPKLMSDRNDLNVRMKYDTNVCSIKGICILPDDGLLVADKANDKLKRLNSFYQITDYFNIKEPRGVCYIPSTQEVAVTSRGSGTIQIVTLGKKMSWVRCIDTGSRDCYGIAFNNGLLYVGESLGDKLSAYDFTTGKLRSNLEEGKSDKKVLSRNNCEVELSADGQYVYVADFRKGLVVIDREQNEFLSVTDDALAGASGVCLDEEENVLVCGRHSRTVMQVSPQGKKMGLLLSKERIPGNPWSLCFDQSRSRLFVAVEHMDAVCYFDVISK